MTMRTNSQIGGNVARLAALAVLLWWVGPAAAEPAGDAVPLRSTMVESADGPGAPGVELQAERRWIVRFEKPAGLFEKGRLVGAGLRVEAPLPNNAFLVSVPVGRTADPAAIAGVDWALPYDATHKVAPELAAENVGSEDVIVVAHLFADADVRALADELAAAGLEVEGLGRGPRFGRIVLSVDATELAEWRDVLAARDDVFWLGRRYRRTLQNDDVIWVDQSGLDGNMLTPVHDRGLRGEGQIGAVLDTGIDADSCYYRDDVNGLPPTNTGLGTTVDLAQRKVIAVDFLDPAEDPADPTDWDTQGHGTHVAGTMVADDLATPIGHDSGDGLAPAAKVVIQDAGYAPDDCGDLPGIGCPVTDLTPVFQQAYDQGARVHNNSWNDNENAPVQNTYTDASQDVDEFVWANPDFLVLFGAGNHALGGVGTMGSPGTCKNGMAVGATYNAAAAVYLSDISAWGPTDDGRIKPDLLSPGASIRSARSDSDVTTNNCETQGSTGTSHASPGAAGGALLVRQYFVEGWYPTGAPVGGDAFNPSAALVKAMLMNSAVPIEFDAQGNPIEMPGDEQGWGRMKLDNAMYFAGESRRLFIDENTAGLADPADPPVTYLLEVLDDAQPLKITLAWSDFPSTPAAAVHLVNDLDLRVVGDSGSFWGNAFRSNESWGLYGPDRRNNVEQVLIDAPAPGTYSIQVSAAAVPAGPQPFALVVSGAVAVGMGPRPAYLAHSIDDSGPRGNGDGVLDPGESAIVPIAVRNSGDAEAIAVLGNLYSATPGRLKIYDGAASYGDIEVNGERTSDAPHFEVTLEPAAECGEWLGASMGLSGAGFVVGSALSFEIGTYEGDRPSVDTPVTIPKSAPEGVWSLLPVDGSFPITDLSVTVNIDHPDISQLRVILYAPDNTLVFLHDFTGAGVSGLHETWSVDNPPAVGSLEDLLDSDPQGTWRLKVVDNVGGGTPAGELVDWTLHFSSDVPFDCNPVGCGEPVPSAVGDTLVVARSGAADVQLSWQGVGAADYHVWRSEDREQRSAAFAGASGGSTSLVDVGAQGLPGVHYYVVRSANTCRWESD